MVSVFRGVKPELIHFLFPANLVSAYLHPFPLCVCWHCLSFITWFLFSVPSSSLSAGLTWSHNACLKVLNAYFLSFLTGGVLLDTLLSAKLSTVLELHIKYLFVLLFFSLSLEKREVTYYNFLSVCGLFGSCQPNLKPPTCRPIKAG